MLVELEKGLDRAANVDLLISELRQAISLEWLHKERSYTEDPSIGCPVAGIAL